MLYKNIGKHRSEIVTQYICHELSHLFGNLGIIINVNISKYERNAGKQLMDKIKTYMCLNKLLKFIISITP